MSYRTSRHQANHAVLSLGRRRQAKRSQAILEALEQRRMLSGYTGYTFTLAAQSGTNQAAINLNNGTYLQALINGTSTITGDGVTNHTITLGDTLILPDTYDYDMGGIEALNLPNLGAAAALSSANVSGGQLTGSLTMTFDGGGYNSVPTVEFFGGSGSGATATVTMGTSANSGCNVASITVSGGSGYSSSSLPTIAIVGGGLGNLTIESSGYAAGDLGSSMTRFNAASDVPYDAQISSGNVNGIIQTVLSDSHSHSGAAQNYSFDGIEISPDSATDVGQVPYVLIGLSGSTQDYDQLVPSNFTFNQDYIHGGILGETTDDLSTAKLNTGERGGMALNANYVTVENSQISDISEPLDTGIQATGIYATNALGNFTINNNYLEATGEDMIMGGAAIYLPSPAQPTNISLTDNYITKNPAWNPYLPQYAGVPMGVCDNIEFKTAINVTISHNVIENDWFAEDNMWGEAINISNIDSGANPWTDAADFTITDNVIRNVGMIIDIGGGDGTSGYYTTGGLSANGTNPSEITHDITFSNNLAYNIGGFQWGRPQDQSAILMSSGQGPAQNITIDNNTYFGVDAYLEQFSTSLAVKGLLASNFVFQNNVVDESTEGLDSDGLGQDINGLNSTHFDTLTITNPGSGYTYSTNGFAVTISGGGGSGATAQAYVWPTTVVGPNGSEPCPLAGELEYIQVTNCGTGYTSAPTVTISGDGGSGATATAIAESNGQIHSYTFTNNLIIGGSQSNYPVTNATTINYFPSSENAVEMMDVAGDEYGILSTSPYYSDGTGGSTPGVNMSGFVGTGGDTPWNPADVNNSLQNYYKFDEGSGTTAHDNGLGTHENGTLNGTYAWNTTGPAGGGISFTGSTSGNVSVSNFTADSSFTFAAWVKPTNFSATQYIASTKNSSSVSASSLSLNTSGKLVATGTTGSVTANTALTADQWALVSLTYSSGTLTLYVNGANVGSAASATTTTGTTTLYIGGNEGSVSSFNGTLDEVRYYSTSLAQTMSVIGNTNLGLAGGSGYSTNTAGFAVTFSGGGGTGAAATAYANNGGGSITSIIMSNNGLGYTSAPTMSFGATGSGASDTAVMSVSPMAYLYAQYGPRFLPAYMDESLAIHGTGGTFDTAAISPDGTLPSSSFAWSCVNYPDALDISTPTSINLDTQNPVIVFHGAGRYVFQCVVTDSLGQSATLYLPFTVDAVVTPNQPVSPASYSLGTNAAHTFTVNGTSIASLGNTLSDQFNNPMPSSGWNWSVADADNPGTITSGGVYTAPSNVAHLPETFSQGVQLHYGTPDGVSYQESSASITVIDVSAPSAPATITVTPGASNSNVITWTAPNGGGETGYDVYQATDDLGNDGNLIYSSTNLSTLSFTDNAANDPTYAPIAGDAYYYYVEAFNANGNGPATQELGIVTGAPAAPSNIVATPGVNSVALTWTNSAVTVYRAAVSPQGRRPDFRSSRRRRASP